MGVCVRAGHWVSPPAALTRTASSLLVSNKRRRDDGIGLTKEKPGERQRCGWMLFSFSAVTYSAGRVGQGRSGALNLVCILK